MVKFKTMQQIVGGFLLFTILTLVFAVFYMIKEKRYFERKINFFSILDRGDGLSPNTPVVLKGINVGYLQDIDFNEDDRIIITYSIFPEFKKLFRGRTFVKISSLSLLGGKMIEVINDNSGDELANWTIIPTDKDPDIKEMIENNKNLENQYDSNEQIASILGNVEEITGNLKLITRDIKNQKGKLNEALSNVQSITSHVSHITGEIKETSPAIKRSIIEAQSTIENVDEMVQGFKGNRIIQFLGSSNKEESVRTEVYWDPRE